MGLIDGVSYSFGNASLTVLTVTELGERRKQRLNDASHLEGVA